MHFLSCGGELNHHGKFVCDSMYEILKDDYIRVTTQNIIDDRIKLGYKEADELPYNLRKTDISDDELKELISWCDVVDYGAAPIKYLNEAIKQNKIVFIRFERLFKEGMIKLFYPPVFMRYYHKYIKHRNNPNVYFLCISAYGAADLAKLGIKGDRVLKWAYCPEFKELPDEAFKKKDEKLNIVWCGRLIKLKHPEMLLKIASHLKAINCNFSLKIVGDGVLKAELAKKITKLNLSDCVQLCGAVASDKVRNMMLDSDVFIATSDKREGWGVVINEAMSCGCAVFATKTMGAVPTLIKDGENGFYISKGKEAEAAKKIKELSESSVKLEAFKRAAYNAIRDDFSPDIYAKAFTEIAQEVINGKLSPRSGLGEIAKII